jgi:urea transport system substrate-binding protein
VLLVGDDAARFNRAFAAAGLHERALRLSTLMDETMLLASGPDATVGLWSAAGYFETLATPESLSFGASYARRFGAHAPPVGSPGESCYEGLKFLAALAGSPGPLVGSPGHRRPRRRLPWTAAVDSTPTGLDGYEGARGALRLRGNHVEQPVYLAEADGLDFHVRQRL